MLNFLSASCLIILISVTIFVRCGNENEALHFTRNKIPRLIFDKVWMEAFKYPMLMYPSATACPIRSEQEDAFNKKNSFGKNSLFVRNTYEGDKTSENVDYYVCENPYKLSVIYHNKEIEFQFGFEVYYDKSEYKDEGFIESSRGDYDSITNTNAYINYIKQLYSYLPSLPLSFYIPSVPVISKLLQGPLYLDEEHKKEMGFIWIGLFWMKFDFSAKRVAQATYTLSVATRGLQKCDNYDLGKEFFGGVEIEDLYNKENQKRMLKDVKLPQQNSDPEFQVNEMGCESENQCFTKWSIVPAQEFQQAAIKPTSCSDLLTVPVWKSVIHDHLITLDNFLFALSTVIGNPIGDITVHSGVYGVLQLPINSYLRSKKSITLTENDIPVPDIIYKYVKYKTKVCQAPPNISKKNNELKNSESKPSDGNETNDQLQDPKPEPVGKNDENNPDKPAESDGKTDEFQTPECNWATSAIVVIIHNNPYFTELERICQDECEVSGWEIIKYRNITKNSVTSLQHIYCCRANDPNVRKKLGIKYVHDTEYGAQSSSAIFSLKAVPMYNYDTNRFEPYDAHSLVVNAYKTLFEGLEYKPSSKKKWNSFMSNYHINMAYFLIEEPKHERNDAEKFEVDLQDPEEAENSTQNEKLDDKK